MGSGEGRLEKYDGRGGNRRRDVETEATGDGRNGKLMSLISSFFLQGTVRSR